MSTSANSKDKEKKKKSKRERDQEESTDLHAEKLAKELNADDSPAKELTNELQAEGSNDSGRETNPNTTSKHSDNSGSLTINNTLQNTVKIDIISDISKFPDLIRKCKSHYNSNPSACKVFDIIRCWKQSTSGRWRRMLLLRASVRKVFFSNHLNICRVRVITMVLITINPTRLMRQL